MLRNCAGRSLTRLTSVTPEVIGTLTGNQRPLMMTTVGDLLADDADCEARDSDEKLFLEICAPPAAETKEASPRCRRASRHGVSPSARKSSAGSLPTWDPTKPS